MERSFVVDLTDHDACQSFSLRGNIDVHSEELINRIPGQIEKRTAKFDFSHVGRVNSMGIALLLRCFKKIRDEKKTEILLTGLNTIHTMLFKTTGIFLLTKLEEQPSPE